MTTTPRRRRRRRVNPVVQFFQDHWKALLVLVVAIVLIIIIASTDLFGQLSNAISGNRSDAAQTTVVTGDTGIATLDGKTLGVFETQEAAENSKISVEAGKKILAVSKSGNVDVSAYVGGRPANIVSGDNNSYTLDLSNVADSSTVIIKIETGGDGSNLGKRFGMSNVSTQYVAISVSNPTQTEAEATAALGVPNGRIYFGEDVYQTYASEGEAQQAVRSQRSQFTIPTYMVQNGLQLRAEPNSSTTRIRVQVCMVDSKPCMITGVSLYESNNWSDTLDVSNFAGSQVTLMLHASNVNGLSNGFSYVSFFVPAPIQEEQVDTEEDGLG